MITKLEALKNTEMVLLGKPGGAQTQKRDQPGIPINNPLV